MMEVKFSLSNMNGMSEREEDVRSITDLNGKTKSDQVYNWKNLNGESGKKYSLDNMCGHTK